MAIYLDNERYFFPILELLDFKGVWQGKTGKKSAGLFLIRLPGRLTPFIRLFFKSYSYAINQCPSGEESPGV